MLWVIIVYLIIMSQKSQMSDLSKPSTTNLYATNPTTHSQLSNEDYRQVFLDYSQSHNNSSNQESHIQTDSQKNKLTTGKSNTSSLPINNEVNSVTNDNNSVQRLSSTTYTHPPQKIYFRSTMTVHTSSDKKIAPAPITKIEEVKKITLPVENSSPEKSFQQAENVSSFQDERQIPAQSESKRIQPQQPKPKQIQPTGNSVSHVEPFHSVELAHPGQTSQSVKHEPVVKNEPTANPEVQLSAPNKIQRVQMIDSVSYQQETIAEPQLAQPQQSQNYQEAPFYGEADDQKKKCISPCGLVLAVLGMAAFFMLLLYLLGIIGSPNSSAIDGIVINNQYSNMTVIVQTTIINNTKQVNQTEGNENISNKTDTLVNTNPVIVPIDIQTNANSSSSETSTPIIANGQLPKSDMNNQIENEISISGNQTIVSMTTTFNYNNTDQLSPQSTNGSNGLTGLAQKLPVTFVNEITFDGLNDFSVSPTTESLNREVPLDSKQTSVEGHLSRVSSEDEY